LKKDWEIFQQLAERELAENEVRTSEKEKHAILNSMSECVVFHDTEHRDSMGKRGVSTAC
jgi:hypothetical protein